ncbi:MAG TPA: hypothetical protein P5096_03805 [Patescibacteria group bacterium]|nr:hypothetical protein [Patescibacteria group bacterium]
MTKKILFIITILLTLGFFMPTPALAAACNSCAACSAYLFCSGISGSLNTELNLSVSAFDEDGASLAGASVTFDWQIIDTALGTFSVGGTTWSNTNTAGISTVTVKIGATVFSDASPANVKVKATYAGGVIEKIFIITTSCDRDPILYYGIGSVSETGANTWTSSTAEIMETCQPEYKLYAPEGGRE